MVMASEFLDDLGCSDIRGVVSVFLKNGVGEQVLIRMCCRIERESKPVYRPDK